LGAPREVPRARINAKLIRRAVKRRPSGRGSKASLTTLKS
jgi:hypothetical protein